MFHLHNPMESLYDETQLSEEDRHSLNCILLSNILGGTFGIVGQVTTSATVGLVTELGANDLIFGLITAIPQAANIMQLPFSMMITRHQKRKPYVVGFGVMARILWLLMGFLPLLFPQNKMLALGVFMAMLTVSSILIAMPNVGWFSWFSDLCPDSIQSRWLSIKEMMVAISGFAFGLIVAYVLDHMQGNIRYAIVFAVAGAMGVADLALFSLVREVKPTGNTSTSMSLLLKNILKNKPFMRFTLMWTVWCFTSNMFSPYLTPYSMNVMGLNYMQITLFGTMTCSIATALSMPRWGKLLNRMPSKQIMMVSCLANCAIPLVYLFSSKGNIWPTFLYNLVGALMWSGCNLCATYMQLEFSTQDIRPTYLAVFNCISAVIGTTLGSIMGGVLLDVWETSLFHIGFMDRYMILIVLSSLLRTIGVVVLVPAIPKKS